MLESFLKNMSLEDQARFIINLNKLQLNRKEHIKKYYKLRNLHSDIIDSMENYIMSGKYNNQMYFDTISDDINRETKGLDFGLDSDDSDDITILNELFMYKNHKKIPSVTEIYLDNKKFRNKDKVKMLNSMKNSYVGLFKIIKVDKDNGYVTYEDVFTHKKFKIIDVSLSSTLKIDKNKMFYCYNRIITFDDISFGTGIHCSMMSDNKKLKEFIKKHKYNNCSDFSRCLILYYMSKEDNKVKVTYHSNYR